MDTTPGEREHAVRLLAAALVLMRDGADIKWTEGYDLSPSLPHGKLGFRVEMDDVLFWQQYKALADAWGWKP